MNYISLLAKCTDYIREHPSYEITAQELADLCGYSLYHLSSVFRACFGCSIGRYILEERLRLAAGKLQDGRKISDVAIEGGFDTSSGFTKAFRRQFGCSPREYQKLVIKHQNMPETDNGSYDIFPGHFAVQPEFVRRTGFKVYGYVIPVDEDHEQAGSAAFWSNVNFKNLPSYPENASDYAEVGVWMEPDALTGKMDYFFGYVTSDPSPAEGFKELFLAPGQYAVFRLPYQAGKEYAGLKSSLSARVQALWQFVFKEWFSGETSLRFDDGRLCFEKYGIRDVEIWAPVY